MQQELGSYVPSLLLMGLGIGIMVRCEARAIGNETFGNRGDSHMAALTLGGGSSPESAPRRGALLRLLDTMAEWQMRHSHSVISRVQADSATMIGVVQPSNTNERSSTSPLDR